MGPKRIDCRKAEKPAESDCFDVFCGSLPRSRDVFGGVRRAAPIKVLQSKAKQNIVIFAAGEPRNGASKDALRFVKWILHSILKRSLEIS